MNIYEYKPFDAHTIPDEILSGKDVELSHSNFQFKVKNDNVIHSYATLFSKYHHIMEPYIYLMTLNDSEYEKYYQKPKLLSYDLYGTPELWSGILYINNMVSVANFDKRTIKVFNNKIFDALEEIMTIYNEDINNNNKEIYSE